MREGVGSMTEDDGVCHDISFPSHRPPLLQSSQTVTFTLRRGAELNTIYSNFLKVKFYSNSIRLGYNILSGLNIFTIVTVYVYYLFIVR